MTDLETLLERVKAAKGPNGDLDIAIEHAFPTEGRALPRYTRSIDLALALVERVLPSHYAYATPGFYGDGVCYRGRVLKIARYAIVEVARESAATPALAILAALLTALIAKKD